MREIYRNKNYLKITNYVFINIQLFSDNLNHESLVLFNKH